MFTQTFSNIFKHLNIYFQGKVVEVQQGSDGQATQTKEGGVRQFKKMYKGRVDNCNILLSPQNMPLGITYLFLPKEGGIVPDMW